MEDEYPYIIAIGIIDELSVGVIFTYEIGKITEGTFYLFCNKQEGIKKVSDICEPSSNSELVIAGTIETIKSSDLPEHLEVCDNSKHRLTDRVKDFIHDELIPRCIAA